MTSNIIVHTTFLIFTGGALLATAALYTRQSLIVAYILLGALLGPWGPWGDRLISDPALIKQIGDVGILFLLFLLGLHLHPQKLLGMIRKVTLLSVVSSLIFFSMGFGVAAAFGYSYLESSIVGAAIMFSSTIIGLKLLPTTILHHQHTGEVMISVLLFQDLIAIVVLLLVNGANTGGITLTDFALVGVALPAMIALAFLVERFVLIKLLRRFDRTQEYIFLLSIGWCLGLSMLGRLLGLSEEIGAFIAGVSLAASPIALYIAESLKPLRDFFLVMFFFSVGASFNFNYLHVVIIPAGILAVLILLIKPIVYYFLLRNIGESKQVSEEVGVRLGQASEFSLLVAGLALTNGMIGNRTGYMILATTIITFLVSSYVVVLRYPTPVALSDKMRRD